MFNVNFRKITWNILQFCFIMTQSVCFWCLPTLQKFCLLNKVSNITAPHSPYSVFSSAWIHFVQYEWRLYYILQALFFITPRMLEGRSRKWFFLFPYAFESERRNLNKFAKLTRAAFYCHSLITPRMYVIFFIDFRIVCLKTWCFQRFGQLVFSMARLKQIYLLLSPI